MLGQNLLPRGYDPRVDAMPEDKLRAKAAQVRGDVRAAVESTSEHGAFISQIGAASQTSLLTAN
jgi:tryptophan halogenase